MGVPLLTYLDLSRNNLTYISDVGVFLDTKPSLEALHLSNNPLYCDCGLDPLRKWYKANYPSEPATCTYPAELRAQRIASLDQNLFCFIEEPIRLSASPSKITLTTELTTRTDSTTGTDSGINESFKNNSFNLWVIMSTLIVTIVVILFITIITVSYKSYHRKRHTKCGRNFKPSGKEY